MPRAISFPPEVDTGPHRLAPGSNMPQTKAGRRRRSSSLIYQEPPESIEHTSDQAALPNLNANWVNAKGAWTIHFVLIVALKIFYDIIPGVSQETSWTLTNISYMFGSFLMFHWVRGIPFEFNAGAYDNLNMWEQIDNGDQYTPTKKFLLCVPICLFLLSTHYTHYDLTYFTINFLATLGVVIPKLPFVASNSEQRGMEILRFGFNNILELLHLHQRGDSPLSSPSMAQSASEAELPLYHPAKPLPFELAQHAAIFFEEKLHTQALNLLQTVLTSRPDRLIPIFIPSPHHLALAATFLVHPSTTARQDEEVPNVALRLLRLVNTLVGPISGRFSSAFSFTHFESSRHGRRRHVVDDAHSAATNDGGNKPLNLDRHIALDLAQSSSLWSRAEDFWHAVGWAFNCSVLHPFRWERWRIWLEFMCQVLEDDWEERKRQHEKDPPHDSKILHDSMIMQYIMHASGAYGRNRRILRAIFADGGAVAVNEFREVFHHELKHSRKKVDGLPKNGSNLKKRGMEVNIDAEQYGDYLSDDPDDEDCSSSPGPTIEPEPKRPRRAAATATRTRAKRSRAATSTLASDSENVNFTPSAATAVTGSLLGDMTSLALRQRLLHMLSCVSKSLGKESFADLDELYHLFVENIRPLPLPIFQAFVSPSALPHFLPDAQTSLCELLLFRIRETAAPDTEEEYLTQGKLELCFLPYAAATPSIIENAKMSIVLESLVILLDNSDLLRLTPGLREAAENGINRRGARVQEEKRKTQLARKSEHLEWVWLIESGERLMYLLTEIIPLKQQQRSG